MDDNERYQRIDKLSKLLNEGEEVNKNLKEAIDKFLDFEKKYKKIAKYYDSDELTKDLLLDAAEKIPENINTGILGEDYAWDFLCEYEYFASLFKK